MTISAAPGTMDANRPDVDRQAIDLHEFDFLDFGCSGKGGSLDFGQKIFRGNRGLGLDLDPRKITQSREKGLDVALADLTKPIAFTGRVRFTQLFHFLEHLYSVADAKSAIGNAIAASKDFIVIRQPWFDSDGYLATHNLKLYWSDWRGHRTAMTSLQLWLILRYFMHRGSVRKFMIYGGLPVSDSEDQCVVPLTSDTDQLGYDRSTHGEKAQLYFTQPTYKELRAIVFISHKNQFSGMDKFLSNATEILRGEE